MLRESSLYWGLFLAYHIAQRALNNLGMIDDQDRLFPFSEKSSRIDQIVKAMLEIPLSLGRSLRRKLHDHWDKDIPAVASYVQVDPRTIIKYVHGTHTKYLDREI